MALDHSLTYKKRKLRNLPHQLRLKKILSVVGSFSLKKNSSYLDVGCSNGYITGILFYYFKFAAAKGLDHTMENLQIARNTYPDIDFEFVDLNVLSNGLSQKYELITCFETLEHVGNLTNAIDNILSYGQTGTKILITVPIEIRAVGILKFLGKTIFFNYKLNELPGNPSWLVYAKALFVGKNISVFRNESTGWGTHFGFDYREVDKILKTKDVDFNAFNSFSTRFYIVSM